MDIFSVFAIIVVALIPKAKALLQIQGEITWLKRHVQNHSSHPTT